ncbi:MAG: ABC transporter ATP-binding protein [Desulfobacterales bacterium]|jgi:branched-chain amino acid transport system ATP-binding protein|nr:ABC transporter ATP-binding protein [Desulfobacterales bacterium]
MTQPIILEVQNLSRSFGKFQALGGISLKIPKGKLCALIGPNGAGKTTFYNVVSGRYRPTIGKVFFEGRDISGLPSHALVARGLLRSFQVTNIFPALTVRENVLTPLAVMRGLSFSFLGSMARRPELVDEAEAILARVGLRGQSHRVVSTLAYGDKRLIEIAIVLACQPKLVLLDEPTAGMNPEETDRMIRLIKELSDKSEITFFITEHDMKVVFSVAENIFVLNQGTLLAEGTPDEIRSNREVKQAYLGGSLDAASH